MLLRRKIPSENDARAQASANGDAAQEKSESELEDCQRLCASGVSSKPKMKTNFFKSLREHWRKRKTKLAVQNGVEVSSGPPEPNSRKRDVTVYCPGSSSLTASNSHEDSPNDANDNYVRAGVGSNGERVCSGADGETSRHDLPSSSSFAAPSVPVAQPGSSVTSVTEHFTHSQTNSEQRRTSCSVDEVSGRQLPPTSSRCLSQPVAIHEHSCTGSACEEQWKTTDPQGGTTQSAGVVGDGLCSEASAVSSVAEGPQVPSRQPLRDATPSVFVSVFPGPDGREDPRISSLSEELFKLSKHGWYWGPITRGEAEEKLADQPDGAFLVRDSSDDRYLLSLTFKSYGKTLHTRIEHCNGLFSFYAQSGPEGRACIVDLIQESMNYSQSGVFCYSRGRSPGVPSFPVRLIKPVSRLTHVRSLQYLCRFVIRQYTRFDHIQRLPLPSRIKGYLEEGHY
uniref:Suppressor of cytokine signaling 7 n=1 Tax=Rhipicephalus zambeziensis TaxID=60191 RepID=A0A224Z9H4_9ACAR